MHLRNRYSPKPSASSPLDNRARPMANTSQAPDLEGLHREIHGMAEQMRETNIPRTIVLAESDIARQVLLFPDVKGVHLCQNPDHLEKLLEWKARKLEEEDPLVGVIKPGVGICPPLKKSEIWMPTSMPSTRGQAFWQKNASHLFIVHQKEIESLKDYVKRFNQAVLEVKDPSDKVVIMAMMEGLWPGPLFDSLSKNVPETLSALQNKADKYIAVEELAEAKQAQSLAKITKENTRDFIWKHVVCRFKIPKVIISDNARQFDNDKFKLFCSDIAISHHFSSLGHPQANGQVEVTNRTILRNLRARLERLKSEWAEELPSVLWAYHTTSQVPIGETPYSSVFGTESIILMEIGMPSFRTSNFDKENNEIELRFNLDLLDEKREKAELRQVAYKCQVAKYYNQRVMHRSFLPGDLVLRKVTLPTKEPNTRKLGPTWEAPTKSSGYPDREPTG
ncbi:hypothetical protein Acr_25g0002840 [Actinidia rufa]|uniref:Integrase catalytic domain-containing protein n=1 Tax=Actinidia rufa TaxID=165716 RepID=A0A7J0GYG6_9ERIC|nr:hypothetical protein Acr_25g0002840 [Actinidia rufa]